LGAVEELVRRGWARGIGVTLVTQRAAVLSKDVLTQAEVLVALRAIAPQDREAIDAWLRVPGTPEQRDELMASLPSLPIGTAWVWSPGWLDVFQRVRIRSKQTFDSSATPKVGAVRREPKRLAPVDLERLRTRLAGTIAKVQADDPRELRRRIAALERGRRPQTIIERVEVAVIPPQHIETLQALVTELRAAAEAISAALAKVQAQGSVPRQSAQPAQPKVLPAQPLKGSARRDASSPMRDRDGLPLRAGARRLLQTLAQRYPTKMTRAQLGTLARSPPRGGPFGTYFATLKRQGLLTESAQGDVEITPAGLAYLARGELAAQTGFAVAGGTFGTYLGTLRRNGRVEVQGQALRASDTLFLP
jgi:uncharacterized protein